MNIEEINNKKVTINCKTKEEYDKLMNILEERGFKWFTGTKATKYNAWEWHKENTYIHLGNNCILCSDIGFAKSKGYKIISFEEFTKPLVSKEEDYKKIINAFDEIRQTLIKLGVNFDFKEDILDEEDKKTIKMGADLLMRCGVKKENIRVCKSENIDGKWIYIYGSDYRISLPYLKSNSMYKNMGANKDYTLEELGI